MPEPAPSTSLLRPFLVGVLGLLVSWVVITLVQYLNITLYPLGPDVDLDDPAALAEAIRDLPLGAYVLLELSYVLGSLAGGFVVGRAGGRSRRWIALGLGAVLTAFGVQNVVAIPHPLWLAVLTLVTFVPMTWLGARLGAPTSRPAPDQSPTVF
ncbi:MAG: hypothetical protein ACFCGT_20530 [Sandaracinaceae bacterium]